MESSAVEPEEAVAPVGALLDGEDPESIHLDDPEHWVAVYAELVEATNRMLDAARKRLAARTAAEQADLRLVEHEIAALLARAEFFGARHRWWADRGRVLWSRSRPNES
jgi:hypothetical protein